MYEVLNRNTFFVKQQVGRLKAASSYDIYNPESGQLILECREDNLGLVTKALRFSSHKQRTPFDVNIRIPNGQPILWVRRGGSLTFAKPITIQRADGSVVGVFKQKLLSKLIKSFEIYDSNNQLVYNMMGDGLAWGWRFVSENLVHAKIQRVTKTSKLLTSDADDYVIQIYNAVPANSPQRQLILAAAIGADMAFNQ
jgi:uncharacterized protein YxjI